MGQEKLEKCWRLRWPIFIAFMLVYTCFCSTVYEYRMCKAQKPDEITQKGKEQMKKAIDELIRHR